MFLVSFSEKDTCTTVIFSECSSVTMHGSSTESIFSMVLLHRDNHETKSVSQCYYNTLCTLTAGASLERVQWVHLHLLRFGKGSSEVSLVLRIYFFGEI